MFDAILRADAAIGLMDDARGRDAWHAALARLADSDTLHGLVAGRCVRILLDAQRARRDEAARLDEPGRLDGRRTAPRRRLGRGLPARSGEVLYHDDALFGIFDGWLAALSPEAFPNLLPMLRRTFGTFEAPLRRNLGERAQRGPRSPAASHAADGDFRRSTSTSSGPRRCCPWSRGCSGLGGETQP